MDDLIPTAPPYRIITDLEYAGISHIILPPAPVSPIESKIASDQLARQLAQKKAAEVGFDILKIAK